MKEVKNHILLSNIVSLLNEARQKVVRTINQTMVYSYYEIGRMIVEEEQNGKERADYGKFLVKELSEELTKEFGKGFSETNIKQFRSFYLAYEIGQTVSDVFKNKISQTVSDQFENQISETVSRISSKSIPQTPSAEFNLSWSHYLHLMRIDNKKERNYYESESYTNNWSVRELKRQVDSGLYSRLALSKNKNEVIEASKSGNITVKPKDIIKDPYILEFIGLPEQHSYSESELEQAIIDKLEHFLLELGNGFTFVSRQKRISFDDKHFRIDLVFYNRLLNCFVLIDLKIGELKHQDIGQMQMYVNYYDREMKLNSENKTIGIILCQNKSEALVKYTLPEDNKQIFASKYKTVLPSKKELKNLIKS